MNNYKRKFRWKSGLLFALVLIVVGSIIYTNYLTSRLALEEKKKVELLANTYKKLNDATDNSDLGFMLDIIQSNTTIPLILTDNKGTIISYRNIDSVKASHDSMYMKSMLKKMRKDKGPIAINFTAGLKQYIYYDDSYLLTDLRYFPYIEFATILVFLLVAYLAFSTSRKAEQNQVWVGMAKETAHQLGTPISSLAGWATYLQGILTDDERENVVPEMEKDIARLDTIVQRFSKIGSIPALKNESILEQITQAVDYIKGRASGKVDFSISSSSDYLVAPISAPLFDWVIENLLKNALDAMDGDGKVNINLKGDEKEIIIDVSDTGKGIPSRDFKTIFKPGYSTKKRGWGLGLSLSKRIIEEYHKGKIFVKESAAGKGATFRIILKK
jgi:two-component sensor histidine kinase